MNIHELIKNKKYASPYDLTLDDLKTLGELITDDMSIGAINEIIEILYNES